PMSSLFPYSTLFRSDRRLSSAVFRHILSTQAAWQHEVQLQRTALPDATQAVAQGKFDLRTVESALARLQFPLQTGFVQCFFQPADRKSTRLNSSNVK